MSYQKRKGARVDLGIQGNRFERHNAICNELFETYVKKNNDYGNSFGETFEKLGIISAVTRITDKVNRLQNLCINKQLVDDESIGDTIRDLANYAIMTLIEIEGYKGD